ncbi:arginase [candidate division KSB1 bacterium]|nr:arginase [candidate division KSB1 bacterium]
MADREFSFFKYVRAVSSDFFVQAKDEHELNMGSFVKVGRESCQDAELIIMGSPQDEGVRRNKGRAGAALAPAAIRRQLYRFPVPAAARDLFMVDIGDIQPGRSLEETHDRQFQVVKYFIEQGKNLIVIGGGNDISYPDCSALSSVEPDLFVFNIDSHLDVRSAAQRHSGTPYRQLLDEGAIQPGSFCEIAWQSMVNDRVYIDYLKSLDVHMIELSLLRRQGIDQTLHQLLDHQKAATLFWGLDIDSVRSADAPGASAPYPTGLKSEEICRLSFIAGRDKRTRLFEISEVNPLFDVDHRTSRLAALMILYYLNGYANRS